MFGTAFLIWAKKTRLSSRQARINKPRSCLIWGTVLVPDGNFFWATKNTLSIHPEARTRFCLDAAFSFCLPLDPSAFLCPDFQGWCRKGGSISVSNSAAKQMRMNHLVQAHAGAEWFKFCWTFCLGNWEGCMVYHGPLPIEMDDLAVASL